MNDRVQGRKVVLILLLPEALRAEFDRGNPKWLLNSETTSRLTVLRAVPDERGQRGWRLGPLREGPARDRRDIPVDLAPGLLTHLEAAYAAPVIICAVSNEVPEAGEELTRYRAEIARESNRIPFWKLPLSTVSDLERRQRPPIT